MKVEDEAKESILEFKDGMVSEENSIEVDNRQSAKTTTLIVQEEERENLPSFADLHNNDNKILSVLNESGSNYSFKGLMRKLNLHQQSLSRALHRLEEIDLIEKSPNGYSLSNKGAAKSNIAPTSKGRQYIQLLQTYIPVRIKAIEIAGQLIGKWFKNLRWLGMIDSGADYTLQWLSDDGSFQINLRIIFNYIVIETNALTEKEKVNAMIGSYMIYQQIVRAMQHRLSVTFALDYHTSHRLTLKRNNN
jgi:DNA-binding MarR family transcriptional regulator